MKVIVKNMKAMPETQKEEITNACPETTESFNDSVKNMENAIELNITEKDIHNSLQFNKARAIRALIMNMMALNPITTENENIVDKETFEAYVNIGDKIDRCFDNLMTEFIEKNEPDDCDMNCDHNCEDCAEHALCGECSLKCDIHCGECEHCEECSKDAFDDENESFEHERCHDCTCEGDCDECENDVIEDECDDSCNYSINARFGNLAADMGTLVEVLKEAFSDDNITDDEVIDIKEIPGKEYNIIKSIFAKYDVIKSLRVKE